MKKILFAVGEKEFLSTQERLIYIAGSLELSGYSVDILTYSEKVYSKAKEIYKDSKGVNVIIMQIKSIPVPYGFRDDLLKTFIKQTHHLYIPGTDVRLFKLSAFDDFWGHIESRTFLDLNLSNYDIVIMPLPSEEDHLSDDDVFYSTICFQAKEKTKSIAGLAVYPVVQSPLIYFKTVDYLIVKEGWEVKYSLDMGMSSENVFHLTYDKEAYLITTIEDTYKNLMLKSGINAPKDSVYITLINHTRFRPFVMDALKTIGEMDMPREVFLLKKGFTIRELTEDDIIKDVYMDIIKKAQCNVYLADHDAKASLMMTSDIIISPVYVSPLKFASNYGKLSIVYNPFYEAIPTNDNVIFINDRKALKDTIINCYYAKRSITSFKDILNSLWQRCKK